MEKKVLSCTFNIDTACVEVKYEYGSKLSIYCPRVEDMVAENMYERAELNLMHCERQEYLQNVTEYSLFDN